MTAEILEFPEFPESLTSEKALLGCLLISPKEVGLLCASAGISAEHFHSPAHSEIFKVVRELNDKGAPLEFRTIGQRLQDEGKLAQVGGPAFISGLFQEVPTAINAEEYLRNVILKHKAREMMRITSQYAFLARTDSGNIEDHLSSLHGELTDLLSKRSKRASIRDIVKEILTEIATGKTDASLIPTGMEGVDGRLLLYRGDLLLISAPTSCGKSALAFNIAMNMAMKGRRVALYPLEMRQKQSLKRALAQLSGYNAEFVRKLVLEASSDAQRAAANKACHDFAAAAQVITGLRIHMRDDLHKIEAIMADIRAEGAKEPFDLIVIDYLQLIQIEKKTERRQLEIAYITQRLKALANDLDCVVCVPSQVNKQGSTREAEDAENDASALIKIHAEENDKGDIHPGRVEVWKQREGARHIDLPLVFNGLLTRFEYKA